MPNQSRSGWQGIPWHRCDRCGLDYPVSELVRQEGLIVCTVTCYDNLITKYRDRVIADVLANDPEEPKLAEILKSTDDDSSESY